MRWAYIILILLAWLPTVGHAAPAEPPPGSATLAMAWLPDRSGVTVTWATDPRFQPPCLYWHESGGADWTGPLTACATSGTTTIPRTDPALIPGRQLVLLCGDRVYQDTCILTAATVPWPYTTILPFLVSPEKESS